MLSATSLSHAYSPSSNLSFADLTICANEHWLISGKSGSGKTTLMHILGGLIKPTAGTVCFEEKDIYRLSASKLDQWRGRMLGFIFQQLYLLPSLTALNNVMAAAYFASYDATITEAKELLASLGIYAAETKFPHEMSGGEQQRLAIARALIHKPRVILADEPTSNLDDENAATVLELLQQSAAQNKAALVVISHDHRVRSKFENVIAL